MSLLAFSGLLLVYVLSLMIIVTLNVREMKQERFNFHLFFTLLFLLTFILGFRLPAFWCFVLTLRWCRPIFYCRRCCLPQRFMSFTLSVTRSVSGRWRHHLPGPGYR